MMKARPSFQPLRLAMGFVLFCSMLLGSVSTDSAAGLCFVKADATSPGTGVSWGEAFPDLQSALANIECMEIWVAAGTYKPTTGTDRTATFPLKNGVSVYGGFAGTETQLGQRSSVDCVRRSRLPRPIAERALPSALKRREAATDEQLIPSRAVLIEEQDRLPR